MDTHGSIGKFQQIIDYLNHRDSLLYQGFKHSLLVFAGDSGISKEHLSSYQPYSSWKIVQRHLNNEAYTSILLERTGCEEILIDVGLFHDICSSKVADLKVAPGTRNIRYESAFDSAKLDRAISAGRTTVAAMAREGFSVLGLAEIGVANTISAYVLMATLLDMPAPMVVGPGSDRSGFLWHRRLQLVDEVLKRVNDLPRQVFRILEDVGSFEIAALVGAILEARKRGIIIVLDGMITSVAALIANRIDEGCHRILFPSTSTMEPGHIHVLKELNLEPALDLEINYGEGLGAGLGLSYLDMAYRFKTRQDSYDFSEN